MNGVTDHAEFRAKGRLGIDDMQNVERLWNQGRQANRADVLSFRTSVQSGYSYRITVYRGKVFLIVRGAADGPFVTMFCR